MGKIKETAHNIFVWFFSVFLFFSFGYHIYMAHYFSNAWSSHPELWLTLFILGFGSTIAAYFISHSRYHLALSALIWTGYIWLGFFFLLAAFTIPFMFASQIWVELSNYKAEWFLFILVIALYSVYRGVQFPQVVSEKILTDHHELKGLRFVQITDLHLGQLRHNEKWFKKVIETCNAHNPDFLFLTGDLVEAPLRLLKKELAALAEAQARMGKLYVIGNHEMIHGGIHWEDTIEEHGWTVLHNEHLVFEINGKRLQIAGVPDRMIKRFDKKFESVPDKALDHTEEMHYRILLAHEPSSVHDLNGTKPDLILSGHTHGGQIFPFNALVALVQPVVQGWKTINGVRVFAHPGTGLWGPPMRLGSRNSIYVFEMI